eukprot:GFUD01028072.1.p1 GENE.GFUD01028072.1~~GFUD01028072.1.p1  ORF type:complete len:945 (-),score=288.83 GFUD01028072.1:723-3557(-)
MAATLLDGCQSENLKMGDTSLETFDSSLDTSTSQTEAASDDEDDELLALRIAALESIKLKEAKLASSKAAASQQPKKPDFVIKSHPKRSNLLSIVTCEEEYETSLPHKQSPPQTVTPFFDPTRPPPGFARNSPPPSRRFSRSPPPSRRFSRSPRRWSRSPLPPRRRSISPFRRRRSFSRSPRRSKSPLRRRSRSPIPPRRSPTPRRSPSPSEWETDTESEEENNEEVKKEAEVKVKKPVKKPVVEKKPLNDDDDPDASVDDVLKLDATDEVDEFSAFLNEFEDEVLAEKEEAQENPEKKIKKDRPETEKKVLEGKRLRKKIKPKKASPPLAVIRNRSPGRRRSPSPRWRMGAKTAGIRSPGGRIRSPGRRYFSPGRGRDGKLSPRRRNRTPSLSPESRLKRAQLKGSPVKRSSKSPERRGVKSKDRSSKSKDKSVNECKPGETSAEKEERERKDYEERLKKLPTADREVLEARRKKFEKKVDISSAEPKKISLKSDKAEAQTSRTDNFESNSLDDELNADIGDTLDMFDDQQKPSKVSVNEKDPPVRKNVTDLRVQLHKKRQATGPGPKVAKQEQGATRGVSGKHPLLRSVSPSSGLNSDGLDEDDFGPVSQSGRRKVVPPGKVPVKARLKISVENRSEEESDRSPSPPPKKLSKKRRRSGDSLGSSGDLTGLGGRRILVVRKDISRENSPEDISITKVASPRKGIKKSLHLRLGEKIDQAQFSENEIYAEMIRQQDEKRHAKKLRKEVKELKKREKKGKKKSKKIKKMSVPDAEDLSEDDLKDSSKRDISPGADSDEELFRFFEDQEQPSEDRKVKKRINSGKGDQVRVRRTSGEKYTRSRRSSGETGKTRRSSGDGERPLRGSDDVGRIKARLGKKVGVNGDGGRFLGKGGRRESDEMLFDLEKFQGSTDEESLDILEKMKRKNEKRLKRMREIEQDKLMFA